MSSWLIPREELTPDQLRAIELDPRENRLILGGPGSGKTQILLHRGQFLRYSMGVAPSRFHIFVFTKALRTYIQSALTLLDLPDESVSTLDSWCANFYRQRIGGRLPWNSEEKCPDFAAIRSEVLRRASGGRDKLFDFVLVDEGQDLDVDAFRLLTTIANHITVCADHKQQIYDQGSRTEDIATWLSIRRANVTLLDTYRCCPYLVRLSSNLLNSTEQSEFIRQARTEQSERELPLLYVARNAEEEKQRLIDAVRTRLGKGERIAILFPQQRQAYGYAKGLTEAGIAVENPKELDFGSDRPKLMPYHSAKGLTFDSVLLPRLVESSFRRVSEDRVEKLLFVGLSRAMRWAYLSTIDTDTLAVLGRITPAAQEGYLVIQSGGTGPKPRPGYIEDTGDDDNLLDIL